MARRGCRIIAAAAYAACIASPAAAEDTSYAKSIDVAVQGTVVQRCAMGSDVTTDLGTLTGAARSVAARFQLDCNVPFVLSIRAQNGAIQHETMPGGQGGYAGSLPYSLDVELPIRRPAQELISKAFDGRALIGGQSLSSAGGIALDGMLLRLNVGSVTSSAGLLAGNYGEVITITIAPS